MAKRKFKGGDPLARLSDEGFLGYVEEESERGTLEVDLDDILDSPFQVRESIVDEDERAKFAQLVQSIKSTPGGLLQPLLVQKHPTLPGKYFLPAGGHGRRDAAKEAGLTAVPVTVVTFSDEEVGLSTAQENLARRNLTPIEEGLLYQRLMQTFGWTQQALADKMGMKSRGRIKDCVALIEFAPDILDMIRQRKGNSGVRAAGYLHRLDDAKYEIPPEEAVRLRQPIIEQFLANTLTSDGVRVAVDDVLAEVLAEREAEQEQEQLSPSDSTDLTAATEEQETEEQETEEQELASLPSQDGFSHSTAILATQQMLAVQPKHEDRGSTPVQRETSKNKNTERLGRMQEVFRRFQSYRRLLGEDLPSNGERELLLILQDDIQEILEQTASPF